MENEKDVLEDIADLITDARTKKGLSRTALAKLAGVDVKTIRSLEQAERWPQDTNRRRICEALGLSPRFMDFIKDGKVNEADFDATDMAESAYDYGIKSADLTGVFYQEALDQLRILEGSLIIPHPSDEQAEQMGIDYIREQNASGPRLNTASDAEVLAEIAKRFSRTAPSGNVPLPANFYDLAAHPPVDSPGMREHAAGMERGEESQDFPDD